MTIREAILSYPGIGDGDSFIDTVLVDRSLNGAVNYTIDNKKSVQLAVADIYSMIGGLPNFTEYKLSISYPREWYTQKAKELYRANGEDDKADALGKKLIVPRGKSPKSW